jgi:2-iminobutanoate/2-iminopropanoate deaminase
MKTIKTLKAAQAVGPYSQAIVNNQTLFTSGQLGIDPKTGDFASNEIIGQTKQVFKNIEAILEEAGFVKTEVLKVTIFLKDLSVFGTVNQMYAEFFVNHKPARSTIEVSKLPKDGLIEIELIAQKA